MIYHHEHKQRDIKPRQVYPMPTTSDFAQELAKVYIAQRGLNSAIAFGNGWYGSCNAGDKYCRVVIPAINTKNVPYWQARLIGTTIEDASRYQSPFSDRLDSLVVVNPLDMQYSLITNIAVTEGPFDALAVAELGYIGVALMGNNPPAVVWNHFKERYNEYKWQPKRIVALIADTDSVGATTMWQAQLALRGFRSRIVIPTSKDVADMTLEDRKKLLGVV